MSRKKNSIKSIAFSCGYNLTRIILQFIFRSVFIYYLNVDYLGLNSAVAGIINLLSVTELGLNTVITFCLFKPVADGDTEKINSIINYYRKMYMIFGLVIATLGILLMPFLKFLIKDYTNLDINIYIVYGVSLLTTAFSYFCTYRNVLFTAYQHQYKASIINMVTNIVTSVCQVLSILLFRNYYVYLFVCLVLAIVCNIVTYVCTLKSRCKSKGSKETPI